jgi:hypothetical protein
MVTAAGRFFYATAARLLALKFILSMSVSTSPGPSHGSSMRSRKQHHMHCFPADAGWQQAPDSAGWEMASGLWLRC